MEADIRGFVLVLLLVVTPWPASLASQDAAETAAQMPMRARIQQQGVKPQRIGVITRYDADSLHLGTAGGDVAIARSAVIRIQASRGMHSNLTKGLVRGVAIGGGTGFLLGALATTEAGSLSTVAEMFYSLRRWAACWAV